MPASFSAVILALMVFGASSAQAAWSKVRECNNGGVVVDFSDDPKDIHFPFQIVVRDPSMVAQINRNGILSPNFRGEAIFSHLAFDKFSWSYKGYYSSVGTAQLSWSDGKSVFRAITLGGREVVLFLENCVTYY